MLTMAEIESTLQIDYELRLEKLGEQAVRELLADAAALWQIIPGHMSNADGRRIAETVLVELIARKTFDPVPAAAQPPRSAWDQFINLFKVPSR